MKPYSTTPRPRDRLSTVLCLTFAALAIGSFYLSTRITDYRSIVQTVGLLLLIAMTYIMTRNRIVYVYTIEQEQNSEDWDFVITHVRGKQRVNLCRLALKDVREIDVTTKTSLPAIKQKYQNDTVHNFCPTLFPETSAYVRFADSDPHAALSATEDERDVAAQRVVIRIACDPVVLASLKQYLEP